MSYSCNKRRKARKNAVRVYGEDIKWEGYNVNS